MLSASSAPAPNPRQPIHTPGPQVVPAHEPEKKRGGAWKVLIAALVIAGGIGLYLKSTAKSTGGGGGGVVNVPTVAVTVGDLDHTIRVSGTVAAQNFQALLAPRISGSRSGMNRGGDNNFASGRGGGGGGG